MIFVLALLMTSLCNNQLKIKPKPTLAIEQTPISLKHTTLNIQESTTNLGLEEEVASSKLKSSATCSPHIHTLELNYSTHEIDYNRFDQIYRGDN